MRVTKSAFSALALVAAALISAPMATAEPSGLVGRWMCTGENRGLAFVSHFDYRADGRYVANQQITLSPGNVLEGGGGGEWRLEGNVLYDTKTEGRLDRFIRNGVEVPASDPEYQAVAAGAVANLGATTYGPIDLNGDQLRVGFYTCERQRSPN